MIHIDMVSYVELSVVSALLLFHLSNYFPTLVAEWHELQQLQRHFVFVQKFKK